MGKKERTKSTPKASKAVRIAALVFCAIISLSAIATTWAVSRPIGDLYVGLAAGRDILEGKLGQEDDWSFMTTGHKWFNQNWGSHLLSYFFYQGGRALTGGEKAGGEIGLLVFKAMMVGGIALFVALAVRQCEVPWTVAMLVTGAIVMAGRSYIDARPNLTTLMMAPMLFWALLLSRKNVHWIWLAVVIIGFWANMHGGFLFGIGMLGLWGLTHVIPQVVAIGTRRAVLEYWPLLVAPLVAILLAGLVTPFGPENLTHPFIMARSKEWRNVREWQPLVAFKDGRLIMVGGKFGSAWEFFTVIGTFLSLVVLRLSAWIAFARDKRKGMSAKQIADVLFNCALAGMVIFMALKARRFVPLAMILMGPMLAVHLGWLLWAKRYYLPTVIVGALLIIPVWFLTRGNMSRYSPINPFFIEESFFERMHLCSNSFPVEVVKFLNDNNISGRAMNEWRWEGYTRFYSPQIKVFMGGRAQQVYDIETFRLRAEILAVRRKTDPRFLPRRALEPFAKHNIHLVILPRGRFNLLVNVLLSSRDARWAVIYYDYADNVVLADSKDPEKRELIEKAASGKLKYPDERIAALSRAYCLTSPVVKVTDPKLVMAAYLKANKLSPSGAMYSRMGYLWRKGAISQGWLINYLESENRRLAAMDPKQAFWVAKLYCRQAIAGTLEELYKKTSRGDDARKARALKARMKREVNELKARWR